MTLRDIVHERHHRLAHCPFALDNLDIEVMPQDVAKGIAEKQYGYPINVDEVWKERERIQNANQ